MANDTNDELRAEIQRLRDLLLSFSATLLCRVALDPDRDARSYSRVDTERLLTEAEMCFRCAVMEGLKIEIAEGLQVAGNELLAKAVEIESQLQREKWKQ